MTPDLAPDDASREEFSLPSDGTAAGVARSYVRGSLARWGMAAVVEPLTLIASELVGNAIRYGRPPLRLLLRRVGSGVRIDVHDEMPGREPELPASLQPDPAAEGGRGLALVEALSAEVGVEQIDDDGKRVWAVVHPNDFK